MEREDAAGTRRGIALVTKEGFHTGGLIEKWERTGPGRLNKVGQVLGVVTGLLGDARQERALLLGLGDADRFAVHEQEIVARAGFERRFAQGDAASGGWIELLVVLNEPAARGELRVYLLSGVLFGSQIRHEASDSSFR